MHPVVDNSANVLDAIRVRIRGGIRGIGSSIETNAKRLAPVKTGNHRRSIHAEYSESGDSISVRVTHYSDYGGYLELGTTRMAARPHFRPAFELVKPHMARMLEDGGGNV